MVSGIDSPNQNVSGVCQANGVRQTNGQEKGQQQSSEVIISAIIMASISGFSNQSVSGVRQANGDIKLSH